MSKQIINELRAWVYSDIQSMSLMDKFESEKGEVRYYRIVIENMFKAGNANCHLVIERASRFMDCEFEGKISFTDFKHGHTENLKAYVEAQLNEHIINEYSGKNEVFYFNKPYRLIAHRTFHSVKYEGVKYGDTTKYAFVGVYIDEKSSTPKKYVRKCTLPDDLLYLSTFKFICRTVGGLYDHEISQLEKKLKNEVEMRKIDDKWVLTKDYAYELLMSNSVARSRCEVYELKNWRDIEKRHEMILLRM